VDCFRGPSKKMPRGGIRGRKSVHAKHRPPPLGREGSRQPGGLGAQILRCNGHGFYPTVPGQALSRLAGQVCLPANRAKIWPVRFRTKALPMDFFHSNACDLADVECSRGVTPHSSRFRQDLRKPHLPRAIVWSPFRQTSTFDAQIAIDRKITVRPVKRHADRGNCAVGQHKRLMHLFISRCGKNNNMKLCANSHTLD